MADQTDVHFFIFQFIIYNYGHTLGVTNYLTFRNVVTSLCNVFTPFGNATTNCV